MNSSRLNMTDHMLRGSDFAFDIIGGKPSADECLQLARRLLDGASTEDAIEIVAGLVSSLIEIRGAVVARALFGQTSRIS